MQGRLALAGSLESFVLFWISLLFADTTEADMTITGDGQVFLTGCAGGAVTEFLQWWTLRKSGKLPKYVNSGFYWTMTLGMILLGGLLCWFQSGAQVDALTGVEIGLAAPLTLQKLVAASGPRGAKGAATSIRDFFQW